MAPRLATAEIPSAEAFAADSGHWDIAVSALIRAVVLDRVARGPVSHRGGVSPGAPLRTDSLYGPIVSIAPIL